MPYETVRNHHYYYELEGQGPPLLLIGGYTADITFWTPVRKNLSKHSTLIMLDNLGAGRSEVPSSFLPLEVLAEEALLLAEQLGFSKPSILGHSMGGAMAQILALQFPERIDKVIVAQSFLKMPPANASTMETVLKLYEAGVSARLRAEVIWPWLFGNRFLMNPRSKETFLSSFEKTAHPPTLKGLSLQLKALLEFDSTLWYKKISKPLLILSGSEDLLSGVPLQGTYTHTFQGVGHVAPAENPSEFCLVVNNYLL